MATDTTKARKGDLILVERVEHNHWSVAAREEAKAAGRDLVEVETTYEFGLVASTTREGVVKTWRSLGYGDQLATDYPQPVVSRLVNRYWVMPAKEIDVEAVLRAAKTHHWPGHPGQPKAFDSFDEARAVARPYRREPRAA